MSIVLAMSAAWIQQAAGSVLAAQKRLQDVQRAGGQGAEFRRADRLSAGWTAASSMEAARPATAKLVCKEFDTERNHQIVMAFDTGYLNA